MPHPPIAHRRGFTPEAIANIRKRYVETDEAVYCIAADAGVHRDTIARLAETEGWPLRKDRPPRDLPVTLRLDLAAAEMWVAADAVADHAVQAPEPAADSAGPQPAEPSPPTNALPLADRLEQAVVRELAKVERLKEETGSETRRTMAAERVARTLSVLTQTLFKVRALREPGGMTADEHDELPDGADDFRRELARRIDAFVASRADAGMAGAGEPSGAAPPAA